MSLVRGIQNISGRGAVSKSVTVDSLVTAGYPAGGAEDSESFARKLSAVDRCIEILSDSMGKLPVFLMDTNSRERLDLPILRLLNIRPNEAQCPSLMKKIVETSRLVTGNGYLWILRSKQTGRVEEFIPVPGELVSPWRDIKGRVWYTVTHPWTGEPMVLPNEDICHYKGASRDGLLGVSVLRRASDVIAAARSAQDYERAYYDNSGQPSGVLQTDTDLAGMVEDPKNPGQMVGRKELLRREWERVHAGPKNSHRLAILDMGLTYKPIAATNVEAQFIESREISVRDICRFFGIPIHFMGEGKQAYNSNEQQAIEYVTRTLHPIVAQYEEEMTWKILSKSQVDAGLELRVNMMAELKGDNASRAAWYKAMREMGVFSVNEIRALEDIPAVAGGDTRYASLNFVPLEDFQRLSTTRAESRPPVE